MAAATLNKEEYNVLIFADQILEELMNNASSISSHMVGLTSLMFFLSNSRCFR